MDTISIGVQRDTLLWQYDIVVCQQRGENRTRDNEVYDKSLENRTILSASRRASTKQKSTARCFVVPTSEEKMNCTANLSVLNTNTTGLSSKEKRYSDLNDADLVLACQRGDQSALKHLLERHKNMMSAIIYRLAPDFTDSSDILQEVSIRIWRSIGQLRNRYALKSWLNQIITRLYYDELRKRPRLTQLVSLDAPTTYLDTSIVGTRDIVDRSPQPEEKALTNELSGILSNALFDLPVNFRTAVILRDVEGLSYEEIASITNTELGTIKSRIARARGKVQVLLAPYMKSAA
jgi:RNA polymerase sigma-70 factor (ECF subfamily)